MEVVWTVKHPRLDEKLQRQGWTTAQTSTESEISGVTISISIERACNLTSTTCDRWVLLTNSHEVARRSSGGIELLAQCIKSTVSTLGIECKGVLSTGVERILVKNRVGVVPLIPLLLMVVNPL